MQHRPPTPLHPTAPTGDVGAAALAGAVRDGARHHGRLAALARGELAGLQEQEQEQQENTGKNAGPSILRRGPRSSEADE